jgi:Peptidase family M23
MEDERMKRILKILVALIIITTSIGSIIGTNANATNYLFSWPTSDSALITQNYKANNHFGIDIDVPGDGYQSNVPVYAAASGIVSRSDYSSTYGEVVYIKHNLNGVSYETVYAHMEQGSRTVSLGESVTQGERIGTMGATGTVDPAGPGGQHLHFEIHEGSWNINKSNSVDPIPLLNLEVLEWYEKPLKEGQVGWIKITGPINLWKGTGSEREEVRILNPGEVYRVYGFNKEEGQFDVGAGYYVTKIDDLVEYKNTPLFFKGSEFKRGQKGLLTIDKPINLWSINSDGKLEEERVLQPGERYRVYGYNYERGQYNVGAGLWVTKIDGYVTYETPSKEFLELAERRIYFD